MGEGCYPVKEELRIGKMYPRKRVQEHTGVHSDKTRAVGAARSWGMVCSSRQWKGEGTDSLFQKAEHDFQESRM